MKKQNHKIRKQKNNIRTLSQRTNNLKPKNHEDDEEIIAVSFDIQINPKK